MTRPRNQLLVAAVSTPLYNPRLCKTCQKLGYSTPRVARTQFSDCELHYQKRIARFVRSGVTIITSKRQLRNFIKDLPTR